MPFYYYTKLFPAVLSLIKELRHVRYLYVHSIFFQIHMSNNKYHDQFFCVLSQAIVSFEICSMELRMSKQFANNLKQEKCNFQIYSKFVNNLGK